MADWNHQHPIEVWYRYESSGNTYLMRGLIDASGQPILPGLGHRMNLYDVIYVVESIEWQFDKHAEPLWDRASVVVQLKQIEE